MAYLGSPVDLIMQGEEFTLEMLLDEDEIVTEAKRSKDELLALCVKIVYTLTPISLTEEVTLRQLISYIVEEPAASAQEKVKMRYPVVAAELLACEEETIEEALMEHDDFVKFFNFWKPKKVNLQLSNMVIRVLIILLENQAEQVSTHLDYDVVKHLTNHLECPSMAELFVKLVSLPEEELSCLVQYNFISSLLKTLSRKKSSRHIDLYNVLHDIIISLSWEHAIIQEFFKAENAKILFKYALEENNPSGLKIGLKIVTLLLQLLQTYMKEEEDEEAEYPKPDVNAPLNDLPPLVQELANNFTRIHELLKKPTNKTITSQEGKTFQAFGAQRLAIIEAVEDTGLISVARKLFDSELLDTCWSYVFNFENTFCHRNVDKLTQGALGLVGGITQVTFLKRTDLASKLIKEETAHGESRAKGSATHIRIPYLHQTARFIQLLGETNEQVTAYLKTISGWTEYEELLDEEQKRYEELVSAKNLGTDEDANTFKPGQHYGDLDIESDAYQEGRDGDADDLDKDDDDDIDSTTDYDDYDVTQAEIVLNKQEVEAFA